MVRNEQNRNFKEVGFLVEGVSPTMQRNGRLSNPLDPITKQIREISCKTKKTDQDIYDMFKLEFLGGMYVILANGQRRVYWPEQNVSAMLFRAASHLKLKEKFKSSVFTSDAILKFDHANIDPDKLWDIEHYRDIRPVVIDRKRIMRCRPIFWPWSLAIEIHYILNQVNLSQIEQVMEIAGGLVGLSERRPQFGRFRVMEMKASG